MELDECLRIKEKEDIEQVIMEFKNELFDKSITEMHLKKQAQKFAASAVFVALRGGGMNKGYVAFYCNDAVCHRAFISMIVVKKAFSRQGAGTRLLRESIEISKRAGMRVMALEVALNNDVARRFYKKHGFGRIGVTEKTYLMERKVE